MQKSIVYLLFICVIPFLSINAQDTETHEKTAAELMSKGNFSEALSFYQKAIDLVEDDSSYSVVYAYAAICAQEIGDLATAKAYYIESINRGIEEPRVFDSLGELARKEKDYDTQILAYEAGVERSAADKQKYLLKLCGVYKKQKNGELLFKNANAVLEDDSRNLKAMEYKGTGLQYMKEMSAAYEVFKALYELDPEHVNANIFLGNYNYQVGKNKLASARKKYESIAKPSRLQWHEHNEESKALMAKYYKPAIVHLEYVYSIKPNKSIKNMLFVMYTKLGEKDKAAIYQE